MLGLLEVFTRPIPRKGVGLDHHHYQNVVQKGYLIIFVHLIQQKTTFDIRPKPKIRL